MKLSRLVFALALAAALPSFAQALRIGLAEDPDVLDPTLARTFVGRIVFAGLCDKLFDLDENLKIVPVYGETASQVVPRLGHLHITVDDGPWHWLHASEEAIVIQGLPSGPHRVLIEFADANHKILEAETRTFDIPERPASH